jgi:hypothetical protein
VDVSLSRTQLFLSRIILCGHTLLISVTSPWGWVAWRLKNEPNTAATAILNNEHPFHPSAPFWSWKISTNKTRRGNKKKMYRLTSRSDSLADRRMDASVLCNGQCTELLYCILFSAFLKIFFVCTQRIRFLYIFCFVHLICIDNCLVGSAKCWGMHIITPSCR